MNTANKALIRAAMNGDLELFEMAVAAGANIHELKEKEHQYDSPPEVGVDALRWAVITCSSERYNEERLQIVKRLLDLGVDINKPNPRNNPLYNATHRYVGNDTFIRFLLERGAALENGLEGAALKGIGWLVKQILETKALDNLAPEDKAQGLMYALVEAAKQGHTEIVEMFLKAGVISSPSSAVVFRTTDEALLEASLKGQHAIVDLLIECGTEGPLPLGKEGIADLIRTNGAKIQVYADRWMSIPVDVQGQLIELSVTFFRGESAVYASDYSNVVLLPYAALHGHTDLARELLRIGADLRKRDSGGRPVLWSASYSGMVWLIELCLQAGEDVNMKESGGDTPLMLAARNGHLEAVKFLLARGADINFASRDSYEEGATALHFAIENKHAEVVRLLVENGADITAEMNDLNGSGVMTPLMCATAYNQPEIMEMLIKQGADVNRCESIEGFGAFHMIPHEGTEAIEMLLRYGAGVNIISGEGTTPLSSAASKGNRAAVIRLIETGADLDLNSDYGTALHQAVSEGHDDIVCLLLAAGANQNLADRNGKTALQLAEEGGHLRIVEYLTRVRPL